MNIENDVYRLNGKFQILTTRVLYLNNICIVQTDGLDVYIVLSMHGLDIFFALYIKLELHKGQKTISLAMWDPN